MCPGLVQEANVLSSDQLWGGGGQRLPAGGAVGCECSGSTILRIRECQRHPLSWGGEAFIRLLHLLNQASSLASSVLQTWLREDSWGVGHWLDVLREACLVDGVRGPHPSSPLLQPASSASVRGLLSVIKLLGVGETCSLTNDFGEGYSVEPIVNLYGGSTNCPSSVGICRWRI